MKAVYIKATEDGTTVKAVNLEPSLENYYRLLDCRLIDIPSRRIGDHYYDIICDDEGLLKGDPIVTAINSDGDAMLVGSLLVLKHDDEGNEIGLTAEEVREVMLHTHGRINLLTGEIRQFLVCEY